VKVVHVCTDKLGGAARAMLNLHFGQLEAGVSSSIITAEDLDDQSPWHVGDHRRYVTDLLVWRNRTELSNTHFSLDCLGKDLSGHPAVAEADVIHLHWVADFLTSESIHNLVRLGKPIVWTLHDMRPFTGGCHFSAGCQNFSRDCSPCPQLITNYFGFTRRALEAGVSALSQSHVTFVAPSQWIADQFTLSVLGSRHQVTVIPYGVDTNLFQSGNKQAARKALKLPETPKYILLASASFSEKRKGFEMARGVLDCLKATVGEGELQKMNVRVLVCGKTQPELAGWHNDFLGEVPVAKMPLVYRAADVMLFTPSEDNLPNVVLEAMACGLPVVTHAVGGLPDFFDSNLRQQCQASANNAQAMSKMVERFLLDGGLRHAVGAESQARVSVAFTTEAQVKTYLDLYSTILQTTRQKHLFASQRLAIPQKNAVSCVIYPALEKHLNSDMPSTCVPLLYNLRWWLEKKEVLREKSEALSGLPLDLFKRIASPFLRAAVWFASIRLRSLEWLVLRRGRSEVNTESCLD
jgi:glycosyltransferase involved in cell wall biosynthesis